MALDTTLLNIQLYKLHIKGKWSNTGEGVTLSSTPHCSIYWKGSLWVNPNNSQPAYSHLANNSTVVTFRLSLVIKYNNKFFSIFCNFLFQNYKFHQIQKMNFCEKSMINFFFRIFSINLSYEALENVESLLHYSQVHIDPEW